jgi:hypothetical protein
VHHAAAIAVLWIDFVREVRLCWDEGFRLPRVSVDGSPDLESCLLHQKLQMVMFCKQAFFSVHILPVDFLSVTHFDEEYYIRGPSSISLYDS